jgi:hypothetical protein
MHDSINFISGHSHITLRRVNNLRLSWQKREVKVNDIVTGHWHVHLLNKIIKLWKLMTNKLSLWQNYKPVTVLKRTLQGIWSLLIMPSNISELFSSPASYSCILVLMCVCVGVGVGVGVCDIRSLSWHSSVNKYTYFSFVGVPKSLKLQRGIYQMPLSGTNKENSNQWTNK